MREWLDKKDVVDKVAQAWRDAYATAPRDTNEHLEAAKFLAMLSAVVPEIFDVVRERAQRLAGPETSQPGQELVVEHAPEMVADEPPADPEEEVSFKPLPEVDYADH
jgi:hypothetical protein